MYKILNTETGLYSTGGSNYNSTEPKSWSPKGKVWTAIGHITSHLGQLKAVPEHWVIVQYEVKEVNRISAKDYYGERKQIKADKKKAISDGAKRKREAALAKLTKEDKEVLGI